MVPRLLKPAFTALTFAYQPMYWVGVAMAGASIVSGFMGSKASKKASKEAYKQQKWAWQLEQQMKLGAVKAQTESIIASKQEAHDRAVSTLSDISNTALRARGQLAAAMGEAGVAGPSVAQIFVSSFYEEAAARGQEIYNLDKFNKQANRDIRGAQSGLALGRAPSKYDSTGDTMQFVSSSLATLGTYFSS